MAQPTTIGSESPADPDGVGEALLRLAGRLHRLEVDALAALAAPLSVRQFRILDRIDREVSSMSQLAALARRQLPTISKSVDSLVRQGLLDRSPSTSDRRIADLRLTAAGHEALAEARRALDALAAWVGSAFPLGTDPAALVRAAGLLHEAAGDRLGQAGGGRGSAGSRQSAVQATS